MIGTGDTLTKLIDAPNLYVPHMMGAPVLLHDLQIGMVILLPTGLTWRELESGKWGVQVYGESDIRWASTSHLHMQGGRLVEILPTYTDEQLSAMFRRMIDVDPDMARDFISVLESAGFDIEYDDYRTLQGDMVVEFLHDVPPRKRGRLIIKSIAHRPSFCAKHGHQWDWYEAEPDGVMYQACGYCGKRDEVQP